MKTWGDVISSARGEAIKAFTNELTFEIGLQVQIIFLKWKTLRHNYRNMGINAKGNPKQRFKKGKD